MFNRFTTPQQKIAAQIDRTVQKGSTFEIEMAKWVAARKHYNDAFWATVKREYDERIARRAAKAEKTSTHAHCQICERMIQANTGVIAHHGYQRPGQGWQTASCFGARYRSYEVASDALPPYIAYLETLLGYRKVALAETRNSPQAVFTIQPEKSRNRQTGLWFIPEPIHYHRPEGFDAKACEARGSHTPRTYEAFWASHVSSLKNDITGIKMEIERATKRLADWRAA